MKKTKCSLCKGFGYIVQDKVMGRDIRQRRRLLGLTQEELGRRADISHQYLHHIEAGIRPWTASGGLRLLKALSRVEKRRRTR